MSLLNKASLIQIPSGYKDGTLYSAKPTNGDGDFTFSRGSNLAATRINSEGLIEKGRENLLLQSNSFDTTWTLDDVSVTSGQSGYDGSNDAWKLESTDSGRSTIEQSISLGANIVQTFSVYAKSGNVNFLKFIIVCSGSNSVVTFDLSDGSSTSTNNEIDVKSENVGNDWYRLSLISAPDTDMTSVRFEIRDSEGSPNSAVGSFVYIQSAQLELGLVSTDVITTTTTTEQAGILEDMPRLDYSGDCPSLLLEPQRTNLLAYSEYFEGSGWNKSNAGTGLSPVISTNTNDTTSPEGEYNATKIVFDAGSGTTTGDLSLLEGVVTLAASIEASTSIWLKGENGGEQLHMRGVANGAFQIITLTTEWQQFTTSENSSTTTDSLQFGIRQNVSGLGIINSSATIYAYGAQIEEGSYATSYIPTYGSSVTRGADECSKTGISSLIGQTEGTFFVEFEQDYTSAVNGFAALSDGSSTNRITINTLGVSSTEFTFSIAMNYSGSGTVLMSDNITYNDKHKAVIVYSATTAKLFIDGSQVDTNTTTGFGNYNRFIIGQNQGGGSAQEQREFYNAVLFPTALTDAECIELTTL